MSNFKSMINLQNIENAFNLKFHDSTALARNDNPKDILLILQACPAVGLKQFITLSFEIGH